MTCLRLYEMLICFVSKFCVLACLIIWMYTNLFTDFVFFLEILCCVFKFDWLSDEGIQHSQKTSAHLF